MAQVRILLSQQHRQELDHIHLCHLTDIQPEMYCAISDPEKHKDTNLYLYSDTPTTPSLERSATPSSCGNRRGRPGALKVG